MERKLEVTGALGLPFMAHLKTTYSQTWETRSESVIEGATRHAELTSQELERLLLENEQLRDVLWQALERARLVAETEYSDVLSRLVAAACDPARVHEASYLMSQIAKLEPVHLRALLATQTMPRPYFKPDELAKSLGISLVLTEAVLQALLTFGLVTNLEFPADDEPDAGLLELDSWIVTNWAREVFRFLDLTAD